MIEFSAEVYSPVLIQEMMPLWEKHHEENRQISGAILDPDLIMYQCLASAGVLRIYSARTANELVGYQVFTVMNHPHFRTQRQAIMDILYLAPDLRTGWNGVRFLKFADAELEREGVDFMFRSIDAKKDFGIVLRRIGYSLTDLSFMRTF